MPAETVQIKPPNFRTAVFKLTGLSPLVVCRMSVKADTAMQEAMEQGKSASSRKNREPVDFKERCLSARYLSQTGDQKWDGINASAFRKAMISACRLVGFKMTLAKLSLFIEEDGWDLVKPQIGLVRILKPKEPTLQMDTCWIGKPGSKVAMPVARPRYDTGWRADLRVRWDNDQFCLADVTNLLLRVGEQVGIGSGRNDSSNSAGMGWGRFTLEQAK